jgi:hypothetical protein
MRRALIALPALLLLGACMTTRSDGSPKVQTSSEANRESVGGAMAAPLRDVNLLRTKIPEVLLQAMADPYGRPAAPVNCPRLIELVTELDATLGPDLDAPEPDEDDLMQRGRSSAFGAMAGVASGAIPFRSWVRRLTGAERHDTLVQSAITAGAVRRGYLKGLGEARGCNPPATPSHVLAGRPVIQQELKPKYPIK